MLRVGCCCVVLIVARCTWGRSLLVVRGVFCVACVLLVVGRWCVLFAAGLLLCAESCMLFDVMFDVVMMVVRCTLCPAGI